MIPEQIACVGSGTIGSSWALLFAIRGHDVVIEDQTDDRLRDSLDRIKLMLRNLVRSGVLKHDDESRAIERIRATTHIDDVGEAKFIQESVTERLDVKIDAFREIERHITREAILASSTSGLSLSKIQSKLRYPERTVIVHPFNPAHLLPLVEIVAGKATNRAVVRKVSRLMSSLGKSPVIVKKEIPGFAANRIQMAIFREALDLLRKNVVSMGDLERIFYAGIGLRYAFMGPFGVESIGAGPGGLAQDFTHFRPLMEELLGSISDWTTIPAGAEKKAIEQSKKISILRGKSYKDLIEWRDKELIRILKHFDYL